MTPAWARCAGLWTRINTLIQQGMMTRPLIPAAGISSDQVFASSRSLVAGRGITVRQSTAIASSSFPRGGHALLQSIEVHAAPTERRRSGRCRLRVRGIGDAPATPGADLMHPMGPAARTYVPLVGGRGGLP